MEYTIHTIASIGHVKWRPQRKYHIASCALVVDCSINIWDIRRPYIPFAAFNEHKDIASGVAWRGDPHVFLSTSRVSINIRKKNRFKVVFFIFTLFSKNFIEWFLWFLLLFHVFQNKTVFLFQFYFINFWHKKKVMTFFY